MFSPGVHYSGHDKNLIKNELAQILFFSLISNIKWIKINVLSENNSGLKGF